MRLSHFPIGVWGWTNSIRDDRCHSKNYYWANFSKWVYPKILLHFLNQLSLFEIFHWFERSSDDKRTFLLFSPSSPSVSQKTSFISLITFIGWLKVTETKCVSEKITHINPFERLSNTIIKNTLITMFLELIPSNLSNCHFVYESYLNQLFEIVIRFPLNINILNKYSIGKIILLKWMNCLFSRAKW